MALESTNAGTCVERDVSFVVILGGSPGLIAYTGPAAMLE
jgi:hypothetical protein